MLEVINTLRGGELTGEISPIAASLAVAELLGLPIEFYPLAPLAERVWQLRANVTPADGWYVALAEWLNAPFATLDRRLTRASGPRCRFLTPETTL